MKGFLIVLFLSAASAVPREELEFEARWKELRSRITQASGQEARLAALKAAQADIRDRIPKAEALLSGGDRSARKLVLSLQSLDGYLEQIPVDAFDRGRCESYRDAIVFSFSPRDPEPKAVPGEAGEALLILKQLCG